MTHSGSILVVDDEPAVRRFTADLLVRAGYEVEQAAGGAEAMQLIEEYHPALLLTDIVMPGMSGLALAAEAHRRFPGMRVLFMSGFSKDYEGELVGSVCLSKPFTPAQLLAAVDEALRIPTPEAETSV